MSKPKFYGLDSNRLTAYPDDEEANVCVTDVLRVYCEHTIDGEHRTAGDRNLFEVVPPLNKGSAPKKGQKGAKKGSGKRKRKGGERHDGRRAEEEVNLVYSCDEEPTLAKSPSSHQDATLEKKSLEGGVPRYTLKCRAPSPDLALLEKEFWNDLKEPNVYKVEGIGDSPFKIKAYCPDRYTLATDFPAMKSISGGVKIEERMEEAEEVEQSKREVTRTVQEQSWAPTHQQLETVDATVVEDADGTSVEQESKEQQAPAQAVRLRRNDRYVQANVVELASSGLQLASTIQELVNRVQDNAPKFGWYFEAQTQVMQGTLNFKWGWREYAKAGQEHRAFYWLCFEADIALLQVSVELGIGVEGFGFQLQVFGRIQGEVRLKSAVQRISPDSDGGLTAIFKGEVIGGLGARFKAPYLVEAKGKVKTKLTVEGEVRARQDDGLRITLDNYWNGITALVSCSVGPDTKLGRDQKEKTKSVEVVSPPSGQKGFLLNQWTWPDDSRYEPERIPRSDVKAVFKEVFKAGRVILGGEYDIRVREHGHRERTDSSFFKGEHTEPDYTWWSMDEVVEAVVKKIEQRPNLDMSRKSVEAMALEIRKELEKEMQSHREEHEEKMRDPERSADIPFRKRHLLGDWKDEGTPHLRAIDYEAFLEGEAFQDLLDDYVDPVQETVYEIENA